MPARYVRKKRTFARRHFSKRPSKQFTAKVKKVINKVAEKKYFTVIQPSVGVDNTGAFAQLGAVTQGDTDTTRDGDQLYIRSLQVKGQVTAGDTTNLLRVIIFQWFLPTTPTATDLLLSNVVDSPWNHDNRYLFKVVVDKSYSLATASNAAQTINWRISKGFKRKCQFNGGTTIGTNKFWIFTISDSGGVPNPSVSYYTKLNFTDS